MLAQPTQLAHFSYVIGRHYIPMSSCFYSTVVSVYGLQSSSIMPLLIGFDRFMTVFFPFWFCFRRSILMSRLKGFNFKDRKNERSEDCNSDDCVGFN